MFQYFIQEQHIQHFPIFFNLYIYICTYITAEHNRVLVLNTCTDAGGLVAAGRSGNGFDLATP